MTNVINAPCGCPACDEGIQSGHFACDQADPGFVAMEARGEVVRYFDGSSWVWEWADPEARI